MATSSSYANLEEYRALIATGLSCLETVLQTGKLSPRQEALTRLRYAAVLFEETENYAETEQALSRGISLCEKVSLFESVFMLGSMTLLT